MNTMLLVGLLAVTSGQQSPSTVAVQVPELNSENFSRWREYIVPDKDEVSWQEIPWRTRFFDGLREANERELPILLWAMNGHPYACT